MIEDPPLLQIRRNFKRPEPALLQRFAGVPTEHVADAMDGRGALDYWSSRSILRVRRSSAVR
jgi:4-hydroxy-4-methyl-2-oxoglutarate aldolase